MICARCGADPGGSGDDPRCEACGDDPRLDGRYRLDRLLGQGTHGMTYAASGLDGREVAVKMVNLGHGVAAERRAALDREVAVMRTLTHARIPAMLDDFTVRSGMTRYRCIVQTFVDGPDLAAVVRTHRPAVADVLGWVAEIADVLAWLHGRAPPIIHRDIKPQNILRRRADGALVLIDFGSVRDTVVETLGGTMGIGTAGYMAPEQLTGDVTAKSDIFSLGATAIELLTRRPPHELRERGGRLVWPRDAFPAAVAAFIDRLVDPEPDARPSAAEARDAARRLAADPDPEPSARPAPLTLEKPTPLIRPAPIPTALDPRPRSTDVAAAERARLALGGLILVVIAGLFVSPFLAEGAALAGLIGAPLALYTAWQGHRAGSRTTVGVALSVFGLIAALFAGVNILNVGPRDARAVFPALLIPFVVFTAWPTWRALGQLRGPRGAQRTMDAGSSTLAEHRRAVRWSRFGGAAMLVGGIAAVEDVESVMITAPLAVPLGLWLVWRGRKAKLRPVQYMGLSMPFGALTWFVFLVVRDMSYWDNRDAIASVMMAYGIAMAIMAVYIGFRPAPTG